ncbi:MAG: hypothetical protein JJ992_09640 [Planctomycetes bacterium]|nr:hypothetical protein [Planctomycetota bacterium]
MDSDFDPYYKWLGIPPRDQPPHHYRLLGIEVFEQDRDVIDAAANRVMSYLKDLAVGDDARHSQNLLNEVSRARLCLLNREKKAEYDTALRSKLGSERSNGEKHQRKATAPPAFKSKGLAEPVGPPLSPPAGNSAASPVAPALQLNLSDPQSRTARRSKRAAADVEVEAVGTGRRFLLFVVLAMVLLAGGAVAILSIFRNKDAESTALTPPRASVDLPSFPSRDDLIDATAKKDTTMPADDPASPLVATPVGGNDLSEAGVKPGAGSDPALPPATDPTDSGGSEHEPPWVEPKFSDLPERTDLIDPTAIGEQGLTGPDRVKPSPKSGSESTAEDITGSTAEPVAPASNPFQDLPAAVTLPPISPSGTSPTVLGSLHLAKDDSCFIKLRGGDKAARGMHPPSGRLRDGWRATGRPRCSAR